MRKIIALPIVIALLLVTMAATARTTVNPNPSIPLQPHNTTYNPESMIKVTLTTDQGFENNEWTTYGTSPNQIACGNNAFPYLGNCNLQQGSPGGLYYAEQTFTNPTNELIVDICWNINTQEPEPADNDILEIYLVDANTGLTTDSLWILHDENHSPHYSCHNKTITLWPSEWRITVGSLNNNTYTTTFNVDELRVSYYTTATHHLYLPNITLNATN